jgi:hypothetical protein
VYRDDFTSIQQLQFGGAIIIAAVNLSTPVSIEGHPECFSADLVIDQEFFFSQWPQRSGLDVVWKFPVIVLSC